VSAPARSLPQTRHAEAPEASVPDEILRFQESERRMHWALAVPFMVCYTTALILVFVYNPHPLRPFRAVVSWTHRASGVCLFVLPLWTIARYRREFAIHWQNIGEVWRWRLDDVKWLFLMGPSTLNKKIELPDSDKFNAAEKINFMMLTVTYPLYVMTGFLIWLPGVAYLSWLVHLSMAAAATPLILGHIFMATVNPDTRIGLSGVISGFVDRHWAMHHYRRWYKANFEPDGVEPPAAPVVVSAPLRPRAVVVPHRSGAGDLLVGPWPRIRQAALGIAMVACQGVDADIVGRAAVAGSDVHPGILRELEVEDPSTGAEGDETPAANWPRVREGGSSPPPAPVVPEDCLVPETASPVCD
jgi:formate dehydrogenase subunit gamma